MTSPLFAAMFAEAWSALIANRLRSLLTMLGMIIGVAAVILMLAIGGGVQREVSASISGLGSNLLIITAGSGRQGGIFGGAGTGATLRIDDAEAIAALPDVVAASPSTSVAAQVVAGPTNWATNISGVTPSWFTVNEWQASEGRIFFEREDRAGARVAVIGQTVAAKLFGARDAIDQLIRIKGVTFTVIGVLDARGQGFGGQDRDDQIVVPLTSATRLLQANEFRGTIRNISVSIASAEALEPATDDIIRLLRRLHRLRPGEQDDFQVANLTAITDTLSVATTAVSLLLAAIGSISLVVGGIGIMNIMLVSVTERTREIGIRMAIGASRAAVRLQFLMEAMMLSLIGCGIGVVTGISLAVVADGLLSFETQISLASVLVAFAVSAAIGVFFGWWPATRAAKLSPIEALRS
ncbi:ABC transporter permease [Polymorphobacter sp.]|uniref:ABC transporter permease n=1 Tax=Polymorphobacter sp. TaxID=1909290 RepID=UPI003F6F3239